jgi:hypothetical protein
MFKIGEKVVCVNAGTTPGNRGGECWCAGEQLYKGHVYTIRSIHLDRYGDRVVWLDEVRRGDLARAEWGDEVGYCVTRFRPIVEKKTDISAFTHILDRANTKERVNG